MITLHFLVVWFISPFYCTGLALFQLHAYCQRTNLVDVPLGESPGKIETFLLGDKPGYYRKTNVVSTIL